MSKFEQDLLNSDRINDIIHRDALRFHFGRWIEVHNVESANHKMNVTHAMVTGAGVSVTSGDASISVAGIDTITQAIDFLQVEHQLKMSESELARVGKENEAKVIANAKAVVYEQYDQMFWDWYVSGKSVATRALNQSADLYNKLALLSMESPACVNVTEAKPTSYDGWIEFFNKSISQVQATGYLLSNRLVMLIDMALYRELENTTPPDANVLISERLKRMFGLEIIPEPKLMNTGKLLVLDPNTTSVKFVIGREPALLNGRTGVVDGWERASSDSYNNAVYCCVTDAIMGNVLVLQKESMLAGLLV